MKSDRYEIPEFLRQPRAEIRERPIIFSAPMVLALLAGSKTQTRRALKQQPIEGGPIGGFAFVDGVWCALSGRDGSVHSKLDRQCPYGHPGNRLWVRETCRAHEITDAEADDDTFNLGLEQPPYGLDGVVYLADGTFRPIENTPEAGDAWGALHSYRGKRGATVPPIHMPRWASRILLEITEVRVERLQDISEADAAAEGARSADYATGRECILDPTMGSYRLHYRDIWEQINGRESWASNPWVWVISFWRIKP